MKKGIGIILLMLVGQFSYTQETLRIMYYNLLNFPGDSPGRVADLRKIVNYAQPDILVVNEFLSVSGVDLILDEALNTWGTDKYAASAFINGPDTDNQLFYNTEKLGFVDQQQIPTSLRDISEYQLYYKSPGLYENSDTIYLNLYSLHLKAGSGFFAQRKAEAQVLKYHLNTRTDLENIFVGGDFNFYSGNESGCVTIRETGSVALFDPINSIGDWNNNPFYAGIHTQSTRSSSFGDGSGGGMDDRFDLIFVTDDVLNNANGLEYITGTYEALGQDGDRFNQSINSPYNSSIPDSVANALFYMSDHLPVLMDVRTDYTAGLTIHDFVRLPLNYRYDQSAGTLVSLQPISTEGTLALFNMKGQLIQQWTLQGGVTLPLVATLPAGFYVLREATENGVRTQKINITP